MKISLLVALMFLLSLSSSHAQFKTPPVDQSPMDMTYFPSGFAQLKAQGKMTGEPILRLIYSRPQKKGREIFGSHLPFGKLWRAGANEATELMVFNEVTINDKSLSPGRYTLYIIPESDSWTVIINSATDIWGEGPSKYDESKDVLRAVIPIEKLEDEVEALAMFFQKNDTGANLVIAWDKTKAVLPIVIRK